MLCKEIKTKKVNIAETVDFTNISRELIFIFFKKNVPVLYIYQLDFYSNYCFGYLEKYFTCFHQMAWISNHF